MNMDDSFAKLQNLRNLLRCSANTSKKFIYRHFLEDLNYYSNSRLVLGKYSMTLFFMCLCTRNTKILM